MLVPIRQLQQRAAWHLRRLQLTAVGGVLFAIAGAFLSAALWMTIREEMGPIMASVIVGGIFAALGAVVMYLRRTPPAPPVPTLSDQLRREAASGALHEPRGQFPPLVEAFLFGAHTYLQVRNRMRR